MSTKITNQSPRPRVRQFLAAAPRRPESSTAPNLRPQASYTIDCQLSDSTTDLASFYSHFFCSFQSLPLLLLAWLIIPPGLPRSKRRGSRVHLVHRRTAHLRCCCGYGATRARRAPSTRPPTPRLPSSPFTMSCSIFCRSSSVSGFCTEPPGGYYGN